MYKIFGARGSINNVEKFISKLDEYSNKKRVEIQVFNADLIFGKNHLISSYQHALRAWERKKNTTNSFKMELLLYASGERQLKLAIPKMGIKKGRNNIAFIMFNIPNNKFQFNDNLVVDFLRYLSLKRNDEVIYGDFETLKKFGISQKELETITKKEYEKIIMEKVAIVDIIK
jgi:tRNA threonylcarbamoyladenosine modification (KEOPS) complex Cgi121 subunit